MKGNMSFNFLCAVEIPKTADEKHTSKKSSSYPLLNEELPWNVISFEDLDLNIFAHFASILKTVMNKRKVFALLNSDGLMGPNIA